MSHSKKKPFIKSRKGGGKGGKSRQKDFKSRRAGYLAIGDTASTACSTQELTLTGEEPEVIEFDIEEKSSYFGHIRDASSDEEDCDEEEDIKSRAALMVLKTRSTGAELVPVSEDDDEDSPSADTESPVRARRRQGEAEPMFAEVVTQAAVPAPRTPTEMYNISSSSAAVTSQETADFIGRTPKFKFGQYKGENFGTVCRNHPDYYFWATSQKKPSQFLLDFMDFVQKNYEVDVTAKSLTLDVRKHLRVQPQMSDNPQERPMVTRSKSLKYAKVPQCEQCTDFSGVGSNSFVQRRTCKVCGTVYQNKTEKKDYQNPNLCPHEHLTRQGSSQTTCRIH